MKIIHSGLSQKSILTPQPPRGGFMKKTFFSLLFMILASGMFASPLHTKLKHTIIIDTDCSPGDIRAISILLSNPSVTVRAIMITDGMVPSDEGLNKVQNLLHMLDADTIPVSKWKQDLLKKYLSPADSQLTVVCLGPLTGIAKELDNEAFHRKVEEIILYIDSVDPLKGFNYEYNKMAADHLLNSGIRIDAISNTDKSGIFFDKDFIEQCNSAGTKLSKAICRTLPGKKSYGEAEMSTAFLSEELVALFIGNHELFELSPLELNRNIRYNTNYRTTALKDVFRDMLTGKYRSGHFVALYGFPLDPELYVYDVREIMGPALAKYGIEEWKACTLTDEFHGHLGVFSIVGAKMGIRAREYFGIGTDLLEIGTYAGSIEPFSCMNDGLQVSTGATLGQGSIHLVNDTLAKPQAVFTYQDKSILIKLKDEYLIKLKAVIGRGVKDYGLQDEDYWNLVRQTAIKFWLEWDRNEIFESEIL
jgi:pyrimidine-specific ribonucleoside hydrolase